jgi:hypothetical protein
VRINLSFDAMGCFIMRILVLSPNKQRMAEGSC